MATQLPDLVLRLVKGSPLTPQEGDANLTKIRDFVNSLSAGIAISLNPDGTLKAGALSLLTQIANVPFFADSFASSRTLPVGIFNVGTNVYAVPINGVAAYAAGVEIQFIANANNVANCAVNVTNTTGPLGNVTIFKGVNIPLAPNDIIAGCVVRLIHDGTNFQLVDMYRSLATSTIIGPTILAAKADMVAAVDPTKVPSVGLLQNHPGVAKVWSVFHWETGSASFQVGAQYNVAANGYVRNGVGDYTITFANPFVTNNFVYQINCKSTSTVNPIFCGRSNLDAGAVNSIRIFTFEIGVGLVDPTEVSIAIWGTQ